MSDGGGHVIRREHIVAAFDGPGVTAEASPNGPAWLETQPDSAGPTAVFTEAAVLIPLIDRKDGMTVLLTRRTDDLKSHAGQIAFPGGRMEQADATPEHTALRETKEEVGLQPASIDVIGRLGVRETGTGYRVVPIVGLIDPPFDVVADPSEVAEVFEVPLSFVMDTANHKFETRILGGVERSFYALPFGAYYIWGLTARLLVNLTEVIGRR